MKREHLNLIYDVAIHAAVEAIQLAAMVKSTSAASGTTGRAARCRTMERSLHL